ncbi:hypothetical protein LJK87_19155 [Paenibacillus sp. P25]|nr:hypothetical protein LJK87_19155 [Paenibacillus sp. P25]
MFQNQAGFHQGDVVSVSAPLAVFNTELELSDPVAISKTGTAALPVKQAVVGVTNDNQGQLVELQKVKIQNLVSASPTGSFEFDAVSGTNTTHVRVDARTGLTQSAFPYQNGQTVTVGGVASIFKGVFQLKPRGLADFTAVDTAPR